MKHPKKPVENTQPPRTRSDARYDDLYALFKEEQAARIAAEKKLRLNNQTLARRTAELKKYFNARSASLVESENRFNILFKEAPDACFIIRLTGKIIDSNKATEELTGLSTEETTGKNVFHIGVLHASTIGMVIQKVALLAKGEKVPPTEFRITRADGTDRWVEAFAQTIRYRGEIVMLGSARDQTARKQAEEALRESEIRYRTLFESETDAILIFDAESNRLIDANQAAESLYGYTRAEFMNLTHHDIATAPEDADLQTDSLGNSFTRKHRKKNGTVFSAEISANRFLIKTRPVICEVIRDITRRLHQQEELRHLTTEIALAGQRERQRIAAELHDGISQLLNSSNLRLEMLQQTPLPGSAIDELSSICKILKESIQQTRSLTFELTCPLLEELGLATALEELCATLSRAHSVRFSFEGDSQIIPLPLDNQSIIYRSTRELLINILKHSNAHCARLRLSLQHSSLQICVTDDGDGFDATLAGNGFSPSGGFGLFNIREYVHHAGGALHIDSAPGKGTQVTFTLPLEQ